MVTDLAVRYLQHAVPYTAGSSDICNADEAVEVDAHDYMNDALNEVSFEDLGDAAISNISDHLHMMADSEAFYSDSAELEVAHAVDELAQSCQALMLQRAMMAMWACISMLLLTSRGGFHGTFCHTYDTGQGPHYPQLCHTRLYPGPTPLPPNVIL